MSFCESINRQRAFFVFAVPDLIFDSSKRNIDRVRYCLEGICDPNCVLAIGEDVGQRVMLGHSGNMLVGKEIRLPSKRDVCAPEPSWLRRRGQAKRQSLSRGMR